MQSRFVFLLLALSIPASGDRGRLASAAEAHLAMGFRIGEVTQDSAIIWVRVTANKDRNWHGKKIVGHLGPRVTLKPGDNAAQSDEYKELGIPVTELEGEVSGFAGQVKVFCAPWINRTEKSPPAFDSGWVDVNADTDFSRQFKLSKLKPNTRYYVNAQTRPDRDSKRTATHIGSFTTAAKSDEWQDVRFTVVTGQAYSDLDHSHGFLIYESMAKLKPQFIVPTGDTVYYDSEKPQARTVELARFHWHRMYSLPRLVDFHRTVPGYWMKDDHDTLSDDCFPTQRPKWMLPMTWEKGLQLFREQVPMGEKTYRTIRWGKGLQIWLVEGRDFRSANTMKDGPEKSIWGKEQLAWFKRTVTESDATFKVLLTPSPIVGPDRPNKNDNHSNEGFSHEGNHLRQWIADNVKAPFFICCGDRHWQYHSVDPKTAVHEFSVGPASDVHASGSPGEDDDYHVFHRVKGGFLSVAVTKEGEAETITFRHHGVDGRVAYEYPVTVGNKSNKPKSNFIEHLIRDVEGWQVHVDIALLQGEAEPVGRQALRNLSNKLYDVKQVVPADKIKELQKVPIYLDHRHKLGAMQYHPGAGWLRGNGYDPAMVKAVHIPRAQGLINAIKRNRQPWVILHELAHAYHDRVIGFDHEPIIQAYDRVVAAKIYESVLLIDGKDVRHYALSNHKEFFAEMTECYFATNDFYPFVRAELKQYDPRTYKMLSEVWGPPPNGNPKP